MRIKKIKLKNIRSFEEAEIEFLEGPLLLSGDIGTGKTTILLAVEYALFGLQPGQKGAALLRNNASFGEVNLELEINGSTVLIERKLRRSGRSVSNEYSAITIEGEKREISITELKTIILNLLQYPLEFIKKNNILYRYTVYTPQEQMKQIILEDPQTRLNIIRHVFGIDKYKKIRENLTTIINQLREDSKFLQGEIKTLDQDNENLKAKKLFLEELSEKIKKKESSLDQSIKKRMQTESESNELELRVREKEKFQSEVEKTNLIISTKRDLLFSLNKEIDSTKKEILKTGNFNEANFNNTLIQLAACTENLEKFQLKYLELETKINSLEKTQKINLEKKQRIFKIDICPTCLQDVSDNHKHNIINETEKEIVETKKFLAGLEREKAVVLSLREKEKEKKQELEKKKFSLETLKSKAEHAQQLKFRLNDLNKKSANLEEDVSFLSKHLSSLKETILQFSKYDIKYGEKQEQLKKALSEEKSLEIIVAQLRTEMELTNKEIENIKKAITQKELSKKKLSEIQEINDWLSNQFLNLISFTERNILMKLRVEFSNLFNRWFNMLAGESFEAHLDENFTPIITQGEAEMDYAFLSGGERTSVALAYRLALNQTINSVLSKIKTKDIMILDEPTDGFSEVQLEKIRDVFSELNIKQLIIVSHESKIEDFVENVIKLRKEDNVSSLEEAINPP
jgi:exonuclease SbcC